MNVEMAINPRLRLAHFRLTGVLHTHESEDALRLYTRTPGFDPAFTLLTDARGLDGVESSFAEILGAAWRLRPVLRLFDRPVTSVILVGSDVGFGMARVMQQVIEPVSRFDFVITRDPVEAMRGAGLSDMPLTRLERDHGFATF